jgi:hypothetical protein
MSLQNKSVVSRRTEVVTAGTLVVTTVTVVVTLLSLYRETRTLTRTREAKSTTGVVTTHG